MHIYTYHCILSGASAQRAGSLRLYPFPCLMHSFLTSYTRAVGTQSWQPTHLPAPLPLRVPIALISDILHTCGWHSIVTAYTPTCASAPARAFYTHFWNPTHLRLALNFHTLHIYLHPCFCPRILHSLLTSYTPAFCTQFSHPTYLPASLLRLVHSARAPGRHRDVWSILWFNSRQIHSIQIHICTCVKASYTSLPLKSIYMKYVCRQIHDRYILHIHQYILQYVYLSSIHDKSFLYIHQYILQYVLCGAGAPCVFQSIAIFYTPAPLPLPVHGARAPGRHRDVRSILVDARVSPRLQHVSAPAHMGWLQLLGSIKL